MKLSSNNLSKTDILEHMFNEVLDAPDLKTDVLKFLQPFVLQYHNFLKYQEKEAVVKMDFEVRRQLENIIYRDLPNIISDYTQLSLSYRNEKELKKGQTHRQNLMENIHFFAGKMKDLENSAFTELDTKANVSQQILEEKYGHVETVIPSIESSFKWQELKLTLPEPEINENSKEFSFQKKTVLDSNQKIKIVDGEIEYKVKSRFKAFMSGTYQSANNLIEKTQEYASVVKDNVIENLQLYALCGFTCILMTSIFTFVYAVESGDKTLANIKVIKNLEDNTSPNSQKEAIMLLAKMVNKNSLYYMKGLNYTLNTDKTEAHVSLSNLNMLQCEKAHYVLDGGSQSAPTYIINHHEVKHVVEDRDEFAQNDKLCGNLFNNEVEVNLDLVNHLDELYQHLAELNKDEPLIETPKVKTKKKHK